MPKHHELIYLDTCILIAWIKNENRLNNEMAGVEYCMDRIESGEIKAITSVNTLIEICEANIPQDKQAFLDRTLRQRRGIEQISVDQRIAALAQRIRTSYRQQGKNLAVPDTTHIATAIQYQADALYTFDEDDLISLSGNIDSHYLVICKPPLPPQAKLPFQ